MSEGIDLAYDTARWQVITQVPFLSLADSAIAAKAKRQPEWYAWEAVKTMIQMIGRVCRAPDDYGRTDIIDAQFPAFYRRTESLWPQHVRNSVRIKNSFDVASSAYV
jgi:Rad3-related DNA helicase